MGERDWELEFEDFEWATAKNGVAGGHDSDDEMASLFSSLDDVTASEDLRSLTLKVIEREEETSLSSARPAAKGRRTQRRHRWRRVVVAAMCLCVVLGVASWFVPLTHVSIAQDDLSIDLGVNVYGMTVQVKTSGKHGDQVASMADVQNRAYEDALDKMLAAYEQLAQGSKDSSMVVDVSSPLGMRTDAMRQQAERIVESRRPSDAAVSQEAPASQGEGVAQNPDRAEPPAASQPNEGPSLGDGAEMTMQDGPQQQQQQQRQDQDFSAPTGGPDQLVSGEPEGMAPMSSGPAVESADRPGEPGGFGGNGGM